MQPPKMTQPLQSPQPIQLPQKGVFSLLLNPKAIPYYAMPNPLITLSENLTPDPSIEASKALIQQLRQKLQNLSPQHTQTPQKTNSQKQQNPQKQTNLQTPQKPHLNHQKKFNANQSYWFIYIDKHPQQKPKFILLKKKPILINPQQALFTYRKKMLYIPIQLVFHNYFDAYFTLQQILNLAKNYGH